MAGEVILVVEDNPRNLKLARDLLQFHGFRTMEATTGAQAIELARTQSPDLVLMDIQLPDLDGSTVLGALRGAPETARIPVVALTAFAMHGDRERFLEAGFDGYLAKPVMVRTFARQVQDLCDALSPNTRT